MPMIFLRTAQANEMQVPFDDGFEVMKTALEIDPDFQSFHKLCAHKSYLHLGSLFSPTHCPTLIV